MNFKTIRNYTVVAISCILVGRYVLQPKQQTKEVVKIVEVEKKVKEEKKKIRTEIKETVKKDGTKETTTIITDDSSSKETNAKETKLDKTLVASSGKGVSVGILALKDLDRFSEKLEYGTVVSVPVFGSLSVIGSADTTKRVGLGVSLEF